MITRRSFLALSAVALASRDLRAALPAPIAITIYKSPLCGCCKEWVKYLEGQGFAPKVFDQSDDAMHATKGAMGVPAALESCHTAMVGGYAIEGHVPAEDMRRLLAEKPKITGLAVPGMPQSAPGMYRPGDPRVPYEVIAWDRAGKTRVFAKH